MTIMANNRNHSFDCPSRKGKGSFAEHTRLMRTFQKSHSSMLMAISARDDLLKSVQLRPNTSAMAGVGGTRILIVSGEKIATIPLLRVPMRSLSIN